MTAPPELSTGTDAVPITTTTTAAAVEVNAIQKQQQQLKNKKRSVSLCISSNSNTHTIASASKLKLARIVTRDRILLEDDTNASSSSSVSMALQRNHQPQSTSTSLSSSLNTTAAVAVAIDTAVTANTTMANRVSNSPTGVDVDMLSDTTASSCIASSCGMNCNDGDDTNRSARPTPSTVAMDRTNVKDDAVAHTSSIQQHSSHQQQQINALRTEFLYYPLRTLLHKLLHHPLNRNDIFTHPVDSVALGIPDYCEVVSEPMCLGDVKRKLQDGSYNQLLNTQEVPKLEQELGVAAGIQRCIHDLRLVFQNAMQYNPPGHSVYTNAQGLSVVLEDGIAQLGRGSSTIPSGTNTSSKSSSWSLSGTVLRYAVQSQVPDQVQVSADDVPWHAFGTTPTPGASRCTACEYCGENTTTTTNGTTTNNTTTTNGTTTTTIASSSSSSMTSLYPPYLTCQASSACHLNKRRPLVCHGKIRRGAVYYVYDGTTSATTSSSDVPGGEVLSSDDTAVNATFCQRCYGNLPSVICLHRSSDDPVSVPYRFRTTTSNPSTTDSTTSGSSSSSSSSTIVIQKKHLVPHKASECVPESYYTCQVCHHVVHRTCADLLQYGTMNGITSSSSEEKKEGFTCYYCTTQVPKEIGVMSVSRVSELRTLPISECVRQCVSTYTVPHSTIARPPPGSMTPPLIPELTAPQQHDQQQEEEYDDIYTFLTGVRDPVPLHQYYGTTATTHTHTQLPPMCHMAQFLQDKVRTALNTDAARRTLHVRIVSSTEQSMYVHPILRRYFLHLGTTTYGAGGTSEVSYTAQTILLLQYHDGIPVLFFALYTQLYPTLGHVYLAYLDSIDQHFFRPKQPIMQSSTTSQSGITNVRTMVYTNLITAYLGYIRSYNHTHSGTTTATTKPIRTAYIWSCPSQRNKSFVFWGKGPLQKVPGRDRLGAWYCRVLSAAVEYGVVSGVQSLYAAVFAAYDTTKNGTSSTRPVPPPVLDGDYWMDEALRLYQAAFLRHLRPTPVTKVSITTTTSTGVFMVPPISDTCRYYDTPLNHLIHAISHLLTHATHISHPFATPVNPVRVPDYYTHIMHPMDLGTIHANLVLGGYATGTGTTADNQCGTIPLLQDLNILYENCQRYNGAKHMFTRMAKDCVVYITQFVYQLKSAVAVAKARGDNPDDYDYCSGQGNNNTLEEGGTIGTLDRTSNHVNVRLDLSLDATWQVGMENVPEPILNTTNNTAAAANNAGVIQQKQKHGRSKHKQKKLPPLNVGPHAIAAHMHIVRPRTKRGNTATGTGGGGNSSVMVAKPTHGGWLAQELSHGIARLHKDFFVVDLTPLTDGNEYANTTTTNGTCSAIDCSSGDDDEDRNIQEQFLLEQEAKMRVYMQGARPPSAATTQQDTTARTSRTASSTRNVFASRSTLLDYCQQKRLQFDTLRRAKHSSMVLLRNLMQYESEKCSSSSSSSLS